MWTNTDSNKDVTKRMDISLYQGTGLLYLGSRLAVEMAELNPYSHQAG